MQDMIFKLAAGWFSLGVCCAQAADVSVNITREIRPGVYGQINIGNSPPPQILYPQPVIIVSQPRSVPVTPVYFHVPPGHAKNWKKHCRKYNACAQPVYFVKSEEYESGYDRKRWKKKDHDDYDRHDSNDDRKKWKKKEKHDD